MKIISINANEILDKTPKAEIYHYDLFSNSTLVDGDIIVWNLAKVKASINTKQTLRQHETQNEILRKKRQELETFFRLGRDLIVILNETPTINFFVPNETKLNYKSVKSKEVNLLSLLPKILEIEIEKTHGQNIECINDDALEYFIKWSGTGLEYLYLIKKSNATPIFHIKETDYVVGVVMEMLNGRVFILPNLKTSPLSLDKHKITNNLLYLLDHFQMPSIEPELEVPSWLAEYTFLDEQEVSENIEKLELQKNQIDQQIKEQVTILEYYKGLKILLFGTGKTLEEQVQLVFRELGFDFEEVTSGRDDLIIKFGKYIGVVEIKGLTKSAAEKNCAQLQKWVTSYHINNEINPKGILIVNTYRNIPVNKREEIDFPNQMHEYVNQMKHSVLTSKELLEIFIDYKEGAIEMDEIVELLFTNVGPLNYRIKSSKGIITI